MTGVRLAREEDDRLIAQLLIRSFSHLYSALGVGMSSERRSYLSDGAGRRAFAITLIYEVGREAVGTVTLVPPSLRCMAWIDGAWDLRLLAVDPRMQGRGTARKLLEEAEGWLRVTNVTGICLHARRGILPQARLYPACGYVRDPAGDIDTHPFLEGYRKSLRPGAA